MCDLTLSVFSNSLTVFYAFLLLSYSHLTSPIVSAEGRFPSAIYLKTIRRRQGVSIPQGGFCR